MPLLPQVVLALESATTSAAATTATAADVARTAATIATTAAVAITVAGAGSGGKLVAFKAWVCLYDAAVAVAACVTDVGRDRAVRKIGKQLSRVR